MSKRAFDVNDAKDGGGAAPGGRGARGGRGPRGMRGLQIVGGGAPGKRRTVKVELPNFSLSWRGHAPASQRLALLLKECRDQYAQLFHVTTRVYTLDYHTEHVEGYGPCVPLPPPRTRGSVNSPLMIGSEVVL